MPVPYLHFNDCCREAMEFYQDIFGGSLDLMLFDELPDAPAEVAQSGRVMHATLTTPKGPLFASDAFPGETAAPQASVSISWDAATVEEAKTLFDKLLGGAQPSWPMMPRSFLPVLAWSKTVLAPIG